MLIGRLLAGDRQSDGSWRPKLGAIDRSTAAVVESSPLAGTTRPTVAYVGGLDGMLHAICIDIVGACRTRGQELWAFVPRVLLGRLRISDGRFDGSPKVADVFGDFSGGGRRTWRTILTFQIGSGQPGLAGFVPGVYALDVTDPAAPTILWEVVPPSTRGANELGVGAGLAMAPVRTTTGFHNYTFVVTNNGGTGGSGVHVEAIATETGAVGWTWNRTYPAARTSSNPPVPASAIPGGPVAIDRYMEGDVNWIAVPSLYGEIWLLDADTGGSVFGTSPLFRFETDFHPIGVAPTLYIDGNRHLRLVVGSGGYTDPVSTSWAPADTGQYVVSVAVVPGVVPVTLGSSAADLAFSVDLGTQRVYSQAVIAGGELYVTTDRTDINDSGFGLEADTGSLQRIMLATGSLHDERVISSGAASADARGGVVFTSSMSGIVNTTYSDFNAVGASTEVAEATGIKRWLCIE
jgi:hypothetical protein